MTDGAGTYMYKTLYEELLSIEDRLDRTRHLEGGAIEPHATAAMHAVRFAAAILRPAVPQAPPHGFPDSTERLLQLAANWREAALELGEFAPPAPTLRLLRGCEVLP
ncbi:hypothetical protein ACIPJN_29075 [Streptomyces sp. NPDC086796]|uniref:hypothetical protein n=1 Tax=Streptomyces sp. NPDC086796 TaxID=3365760 RepID=UPI003829F97D